jgi:uncharacterized membrane protein
MNSEQKELSPSFSIQENDQPEDNKTGLAFLGYILFLIPFLSKSRSEDFVWYHTKQAFGLFLLEIAAIFLSIYLNNYGWMITFIILLFIIWCYCIYNVVMGRKKPIPGIGHLIQLIKI